MFKSKILSFFNFESHFFFLNQHEKKTFGTHMFLMHVHYKDVKILKVTVFQTVTSKDSAKQFFSNACFLRFDVVTTKLYKLFT